MLSRRTLIPDRRRGTDTTDVKICAGIERDNEACEVLPRMVQPGAPPVIGRGRAIMNETAISLMAIAETRRNGYVEVPPSGVTPKVYDELILCGYGIGRSENLWRGGWCVFSPRAVRAGLYRDYTPQSIYTQVTSPDVRVPSLDETEDINEAELPEESLNRIREKWRMD